MHAYVNSNSIYEWFDSFFHTFHINKLCSMLEQKGVHQKKGNCIFELQLQLGMGV